MPLITTYYDPNQVCFHKSFKDVLLDTTFVEQVRTLIRDGRRGGDSNYELPIEETKLVFHEFGPLDIRDGNTVMMYIEGVHWPFWSGDRKSQIDNLLRDIHGLLFDCWISDFEVAWEDKETNELFFSIEFMPDGVKLEGSTFSTAVA